MLAIQAIVTKVTTRTYIHVHTYAHTDKRMKQMQAVQKAATGIKMLQQQGKWVAVQS